MSKTGANTPEPIRHALAALDILRAEDEKLADQVKGALQGYALRQDKAGVIINTDMLLLAARQGLEYLKKSPEKEIPVKTPLEIYQEIIAAFDPYKNRSQKGCLIIACEHGDLEKVINLHKQGIDITMVDNLALRNAAYYGHLEVVRYLHKNGADITTDNNIALHNAATNGHLDVVRYLHAHGADITADNNGAVRYAAMKGHLDVVRYLHAHGADITAHNNEAIRYAATNGHLDVVRYLHESGADITADNNDALRYAATNGHLDVVRYLHPYSGNINDINYLAAGGALYNNHPEVASYFLAYDIPIPPIYRPMLDQYEQGLHRWQETVRMTPPTGLHEENPALFKKSVFEFILPILAHEKYKGKEAHQMAFAAAALFQSKDRVLQYLQQWGTAGHQPLHDLIYMIKMPKDGAPNLKDWGDAVLKCGPSMAKLVKFSDKIPSPCKSSDGKTWSMIQTRAACAKFSFNRAAEHPELATLCFEHGVDDEDFEKALKILQETKPAAKTLPDITINGNRFGMEGYTFRQLPAGDIRGLFLGEITDCCQSVGNNGHDCAKYGYESKDGAFYVVENAKGKIVSQTFAWRGKNNEMCFDTLETLSGTISDTQWQKILKEVSNELENRKDHNISKLTIGTGGRTPSSLEQAFKTATKPAQPKNYKGYSEAGKQILVWKKKA